MAFDGIVKKLKGLVEDPVVDSQPNPSQPEPGLTQPMIDPIDMVGGAAVGKLTKPLMGGAMAVGEDMLAAAPRILGNAVGSAGEDISQKIAQQAAQKAALAAQKTAVPAATEAADTFQKEARAMLPGAEHTPTPTEVLTPKAKGDLATQKLISYLQNPSVNSVEEFQTKKSILDGLKRLAEQGIVHPDVLQQAQEHMGRVESNFARKIRQGVLKGTGE